MRVTDTTYTTDLIISESKTSKYVLAAPNNANGAPTWRALVASDVGLGNVTNDKQLPIAGGTMTGALNFKNGTWNVMGDDAQIGDINKAGHIGIQGKNGNTGIFFTTYNQTSNTTGGAITWDGSKFSITSTTAVDASISGNAATATKWASAQTAYVALGTASKTTSIQGGSSSAVALGIDGTLAVGHGGTGTTEFTANSVIMSGSTTTAALTTRAVFNMTNKGHLSWTAAATDIHLVTKNVLAYWDGRFKDGKSNLTYCVKGEFGESVVGNGRVFYGTCTTAAGTAAKAVTCAKYDALTAGDMIIVDFSHTNTAAVANLTLSVNGTDAKGIKRHYNAGLTNLREAGELCADTIATFIYNGTYWIFTSGDYNNTYDIAQVYSTTGDSRPAETEANGGIGEHRYSLEMMTKNYKWSSIASKDKTATSNTTDNNKIVATAAFLIDSPIFYHSTNVNCAPNGGVNANGFSAINFNLSYSTGTSSNAAGGLTIQRPVYLVGKLNTADTFKLDSTKWWTQTLPTTDDGKIYIYLGMATSSTNVHLSVTHPIYWYKSDHLQIYTGNTVTNLSDTEYLKWYKCYNGYGLRHLP